MFQLKVFKSPASSFLAFTLLSFSACDGNRKYVLKRLPAGDDRSIIISGDEMGDISKGYVAQLIRDSKPSVKVLNKSVTMLAGDEGAEIVSDVDVKAKVTALAFSQSFDRRFKDARMVFRKEPGRKFLFIPVKVWRLVDVTLPHDPDVVDQGF